MRRCLSTISLALCALAFAAASALAAPPQALNPEAGTRNGTIADLRATIVSDSAVTYHFDYGLATSYGTSTPEVNATLRSGTADVYDAARTITGLAPDTNYNFRVVATNASGSVESVNRTFRTGPRDSDGDGRPDSIDPCPNAAGTGGGFCPDSDGDGMPDNLDACPTVNAGPNGFNGCPVDRSRGVPTVRTDPATDPTAVTYTGNAVVNPHGQGITVAFEWDAYPDFRKRGTEGEQLYFGICQDGTSGISVAGRDGRDGRIDRDVSVSCRGLNGSSGFDRRQCVNSTVYVRAVVSYFEDNREKSIIGNSVAVKRPAGAPAKPECVSDGEDDAFNPQAAAKKLFAALKPSGAAARIRAILKAGSYAAKFNSPGAGTAQITWFLVPKGAKIAAAKPVVVAKGSKKATKAGKLKVKVRLSKKGRALLKRSKKRSKSVKLVARGSFKPTGGKKISKKRKITLKR